MSYCNILGYCIQFRPYASKDTIMQEYTDTVLRLGAVVAYLLTTLPNVGDSTYHIGMENFFTSPELLQDLSSKKFVATGTVRANRMENAPLQELNEMVKQSRGKSDAVADFCSNITGVRWKVKKNCKCSVYIYWKETN